MNTAVTPRAKITPNLPADLREELSADIIQIKDRIGAPSGDFISTTRNKTFRLPGSDNEAPEIFGVIIDWVSFNQYYKGKYDPKNIKPPVCASLGVNVKEMRPFAVVPEVQDRLNPNNQPGIGTGGCEKCWANQWKSDGGNGRACKNQRLLALGNPDDPTAPFALLKVSPSGLKWFDRYVQTIANAGGETPHPIAVVTRLFFDESVDFPSVRFEIARPNADLAAYAARRKEARARLLTEPDMSGPVPA